MSSHQIDYRSGRVDRVPNGTRPVVELDLEPNQRIVLFEIGEMWGTRDRKTTDWAWTAWIDHDISTEETPSVR